MKVNLPSLSTTIHSSSPPFVFVVVDVKKVALKIRLFEGRFLSISVDLRSGAFVLNHRSIGFNEDKLRIKEADLNKDNFKIIPTVTSLRYLTTLSFFEGMAHWLKLETFHSLQWDPGM
jgi:hypothetical protein